MADSEHTSGSATQSARLSFEHAKDAATQAANQVRDRAAEYYSKGKEKVQACEETTEQYIRDNPMKSVLIAAGAGLVIGFLLRRR